MTVVSQPDTRLRPLLTRDYVRFHQPREAGATWLATPSTAVTVIINLGDAFGGLPRAFVAGLTDHGNVVDQRGEIDCLDLKLTPLGAYRLFGVPMSELTNEVVDLTELAPLRPDHLDEDLLRLADRGPAPAPEVAWVWRRLQDAHGDLPIAALAAEVGWSRRHLVNRFHAQVGLPPKTVARILRFEELLRRLPTATSAATAVACGYYDQAHMNRDFREFAGTTPGEYLARFPSVQYPWVPAS
jgi:AraC-like DNA-binding protein